LIELAPIDERGDLPRRRRVFAAEPGLTLALVWHETATDPCRFQSLENKDRRTRSTRNDPL
jgi:hypothetical protein